MLKERGIKTKLLTEVTKDNFSECKELLQIVSEIRHLDRIRGNFAITDTEYVSYAILEKARPSLTQVFRSASK